MSKTISEVTETEKRYDFQHLLAGIKALRLINFDNDGLKNPAIEIAASQIDTVGNIILAATISLVFKEIQINQPRFKLLI